MIHKNKFIKTIILQIFLLIISSSSSFALKDINKTKIEKIIMMINIVAEEYKKGIKETKIINIYEYEESKIFFEEAKTRYKSLRSSFSNEYPTQTNRIDELFFEISDKINNKKSLKKIKPLIKEINSILIKISKIHIQFTPSNQPSLANGKNIYQQNCLSCHGKTGAGDGPNALNIHPKPSNLANFKITGITEPFVNYQVISVGVANTAMIGWADKLSESERWDVTYYIRTFAKVNISEKLLNNNRDRLAIIINDVRKYLDLSLDFFLKGNIDNALDAAFDAYMKYEDVEGTLININKNLGSELEANFIKYRGEIKRSANIDVIKKINNQINSDLLEALKVLSKKTNEYAFFFQSIIIILREGFEVIIVISALIAYLIKSNNKDKVGLIYKGTVAGIIASFFTAYLLEVIFKISKADQEVVEAVTMLTAVIVLFYVSYWLISKVESARWQNFIHGKVKNAIAKKNGFALATVAFLAVYREGFETVLFYKALYSYSGNNGSYIFTGFFTGSIFLILIFFMFKNIGLKIPIKTFFIGTGVIMYYMAFTFMGKGLHELQEADLLKITPINFIPKVSILGIYPSFETAIGQFVLLVAFTAAILYSFLLKPVTKEVKQKGKV